MTIQPDHLIVPARDRQAAAVGPFGPVCVNAGLTLDFDTLLARQPPAAA